MSFVETEKTGGVVAVILNRPQRRNALGTEILDRLIGVFAELETDSDVHAIVLSGDGPGFCAGADLKEFADADFDQISRLNAKVAGFARSLALIKKPVVAGVDGFAMGGGMVLAASCDVVVTASTTRWHLPEVSLGWLPGFGLRTLAERVGAVRARRLAWGAEPLTGVQAHALGLADILAPEGIPARQCALEHAQKLAALPPHSVASAKQYFALMTAASSEPMDALATHMYVADAHHPRAQAAMQRFRPDASR